MIKIRFNQEACLKLCEDCIVSMACKEAKLCIHNIHKLRDTCYSLTEFYTNQDIETQADVLMEYLKIHKHCPVCQHKTLTHVEDTSIPKESRVKNKGYSCNKCHSVFILHIQGKDQLLYYYITNEDISYIKNQIERYKHKRYLITQISFQDLVDKYYKKHVNRRYGKMSMMSYSGSMSSF